LQYGYFPTAGFSDFSAPTFASNGTALLPMPGWKQDAGWGFQILQFIDAEPVWEGGGTATTATAKMQAAIAPPLKLFFCPSRRAPKSTNYTNAAFPAEAAYSGVQGKQATVALTDYAGCGGTTPGAAPSTATQGVLQSQVSGKNVISIPSIKDGTPYTLMLAEKAGNNLLSGAQILNEDDMGYFAAYGSTAAGGGINFNTIRFTSATLLPLRDFEVLGPTGGAFGSAHPATFNALMADGSVTQISYTIDSATYTALGTINNMEIISDLNLTP
jgi:prepilin-type processing-associated H-X9-DG protein